jgi:hypothetical protein
MDDIAVIEITELKDLVTAPEHFNGRRKIVLDLNHNRVIRTALVEGSELLIEGRLPEAVGFFLPVVKQVKAMMGGQLILVNVSESDYMYLITICRLGSILTVKDTLEEALAYLDAD